VCRRNKLYETYVPVPQEDRLIDVRYPVFEKNQFIKVYRKNWAFERERDLFQKVSQANPNVRLAKYIQSGTIICEDTSSGLSKKKIT